MIDVDGILSRLTKRANGTPNTITISRATPGSYVNGNWTPGVGQSTLTANASVQNVDGEDLQRLPEGFREKEVVKIYTTTRLYSENDQTGTDADTVIYNGRSYQIQSVMSFVETASYFEAMAIRIGD